MGIKVTPIIAIHAGAGIISHKLTDQLEITRHLEILKNIVNENYQALLAGKSALDVVEQAVIALENEEDFNAGRGAVLNSAGEAELDAALMDGKNLNAGAVAAVRRIKNPISGARVVMEHSHHVLLAGTKADQFCTQYIEAADPTYFITRARQQQLKEALAAGHTQDIDSLGTVGAVARDAEGHLAAATSTGGKTNKIPGRVGDSPIIGAGTWADDRTCAVSGTGDGEIFIRTAFSHEIHSMLFYQQMELEIACKNALSQIAALGGEGGCIAIDKNGKLTLMFNTPGMYRGWIDEKGKANSAVF